MTILLGCGHSVCKNDRVIDRILHSLVRDGRRSLLLLGPRQTGKSTLLGQLAPDLTINLALERVFLQYSSRPQELEDVLREHQPRSVFIDEIQRLPSLLNTIQALIDEAKSDKRTLRFLLTGSSARKLRRGKANLLPGRIDVFELGPIVAAEVGYRMSTPKALSHGTLPDPYLDPSEASAARLLRSYAATYLKEEIQAEALTRNLEGFSRFLFVAAEASGQFLDFSKLAQHAKVSRTSAVRFFEILEDTLIAHRVSTFAAAANADLVKHPRYFFFDTGVLNGLLGNFGVSPDRKGFLFEHLLAGQIRVSALARHKNCRLSGVRTRGGLEIDFIVEIEGETWAIEAKAGGFDPRAVDIVFEQARRYLPESTHFVIATADDTGERKKLSLARVLPWQVLLREMGL